ncbi:WD40 repeat-like protein [Mycena sanguinolenta]|uniref:WD40 repeat-like protein n=1 Tax=Mycena sanguinolenta TaxID=230812 RepID=A0A8H6YT20_9AGAR|nr:WD40 repeat-like protein [Mycena sanguinolenta]
MLAVTTTDQLSLIDPQTLKRPPSFLPSCLSLLTPCTASAWSPDNLYLFLASANAIHQYNPALNTLTQIFSSPEVITHLVCKTKSSLVFATASQINVLESTKVVGTFDSPKAPTSLTLSNDLLATTSAESAHVYNLLLGSSTTLRGIPLAGQRITTCAFHPHSRAKLLLGVGKQLVVYDTTRSSGPLKTIPMNDASTGEIVSVACSPFSKTLVVVACASGSVGFVDLDKEKGLFRTINLKVPLTSAAFSPSGESIYMGTETGKLLVLDLRALDKPPKAVVISESACRVQTMAVQKKTKGGADTDAKPTAAPKVSNSNEVVTRRPAAAAVPTVALATTKALNSGQATVRRVSTTVTSPEAKGKIALKLGPSPLKARIAIGSEASPARKPSASLSPRVTSKKILSPVRDQRNNDANVDNTSMQSSIGGKGKRDIAAKDEHKTARVGARQLLSSKDAESASSHPNVPRARKTSMAESASARSRTASSTVRIASESISTKSARSRGSSVSRPSSSASQKPPVPPVPSLPANLPARSASRTPSPDLPSVTGDPGTPVLVGKKAMAFETPDPKRRTEPNENRSKGWGKGKTVIFKDGNDENLPEDELKERERSLSMQISPMRPSSAAFGHSGSWAPSPLRNAVPSSPAGGSSSAHDLLRTIVRDALLDFQQEQRSEMVGMHLDLLRLGGRWKKELREMMDEYVGDLRELREENKRLREENELLRRGY